MTDADPLELAERMCRAIESADLDALQACYHPDLVTWTNTGGEVDRARSLEMVGWLCRKLADRHYDVHRRVALPDGFLQQHVLRGTAPDGRAVAMPACIVGIVRDGRIARMDEYLDPTALSALR
ncbi:MAG: nuclear transport factor 2 family protein [Acidimicrobiales bacterium]|nr:nuclear transport factor 2 family protein [Acidimicrobiales bacterium]